MDKAYVDTDGVGPYGEWITNDLNDDDEDGITNEWDIETIEPIWVVP